MKNILLIGKFNTFFQEINDGLSKHFRVQMCINNHEMIKGMIKIKMPEAVVISLIGLDDVDSKIFAEFKFNHSKIPVICIGTESEQLKFNQYFMLGQFTALTRPVTKYAIISAVCKELGVCYDSEKDIVVNNAEVKKSILLVDDNAIQLRALKGILGDRYDVRMATSGMNALTQIGKQVPDIIFLDYEMPMCDGKMTMEMIREIDEAKDVPIVFLTGVNEKEHIKAVLSLKPAGYLLKPASADVLFETIERVLEEQGLTNFRNVLV